MKSKRLFPSGCLVLVFLFSTFLQVGEKEEASIVRSSSEPEIVNIAHRGASGHAPEHTIAAYELGAEMGADYIEIDLQMTKDGQLAAVHDPEVSRTTDQMGLVRDFTLTELKTLDAGTWFNQKYPEKSQGRFRGMTIPTLREVFDYFGKDANYYIEIKQPDESPGMAYKLVQLLKEYQLIPAEREGAIIIQSFSEQSLREIHQLEPAIPLIQLISYEETAHLFHDRINRIKEYATGLGVDYRAVNESFVKTVREADLELHAYTVNDKAEMRKLLEWGVTGIFTNYPDRLSEILERA